MVLDFRNTLRVSRPILWLNTAVLWVLGLLVMERAPTLADFVMIAYFTLPFNLWLHGINDVFDYESDRQNARKGSDEGALLPRSLHSSLLRAVLLWNLPFWVFALLWGSWLGQLSLAAFLFLGWAYSSPPIRAKNRPFLDSVFNVAYCLPYVIALAWHQAPAQVWWDSIAALMAFSLWSLASHAFTSIQDIEADQRGGISTVATFLGPSRTAWLSLVLYLSAALFAARYGLVWTAPLLVYASLTMWYLANPEPARANRLYRLFIVLNSSVGFVVTVVLALRNPSHTVWAAAVVLSLVAMVVAALHWGRYLSPTAAHEPQRAG